MELPKAADNLSGINEISHKDNVCFCQDLQSQVSQVFVLFHNISGYIMAGWPALLQINSM